MTRRTAWLLAFAVAFGLLEAAVVVYLRELYYPDGFRFPLVQLPSRIFAIEWLRETTTIVMLAAVAVLAGRDPLDRFFVFGFLFGAWDLVYYAALWVFLGWPESLGTWDVLFLIPLPWLGPVLYPCLISVLLIGGYGIHLWLLGRGRRLLPSRREWLAALLGAILVVVAFCASWRVVPAGRTPEQFPLGLFWVGIVLGVGPFVVAARRAWLAGIRTDS